MLNCLAYLGFHNIKDIERMTLKEYYIRLEAYQMQQVKKQEDLAFQAWLNQAVQATTGSSKNPKPKYKNFKEFFDAESAIDSVRANFEQEFTSHTKSKQSKAWLYAKREAEFRKMRGGK